MHPVPNDPYMTFDPTSVEVMGTTLPKDYCIQFYKKNISKHVDTVTFFQKLLTKGQ